jgi:hypothetical protein
VKQIFTISSGKEQDAVQQVLSVRLGERHFGFSISDHASGELLQLTWYTIGETGNHELQEVYMKHPELRHAFYKTIIGYDHPQSVLVPLHSYKQDDSRLLLATMYGVNGQHPVIAESVPGWQLQNVYAVPAEIQDWITAHFPAAHYWHSYSVGIRQIPVTDPDGVILLDFHTHHFTLIAGKENRLLLAQTFPYETAADVIYHLLKVCIAFSFSQEKAKLLVSGLVEKDSNLYRSLVQYFLDIQFREPAWQMPAAGQEYPPHFFTSLNDLAVCAS